MWQFQLTAARRRLVTVSRFLIPAIAWFQLTAARRRLGLPVRTTKRNPWVSTHSRPKAAGFGGLGGYRIDIVSTHSRPKAAGRVWAILPLSPQCFNSQPPEGGWAGFSLRHAFHTVSTHSRPKAAGQKGLVIDRVAAVSTDSRPKAAGIKSAAMRWICASFNSQPPEGGWFPFPIDAVAEHVSTHSRPKAAGPLAAI